MVLDALFVGVFSLGRRPVRPAATAHQPVHRRRWLPLIYFARPAEQQPAAAGESCRLDRRALGRTCANGSSELMSNVSMSLVEYAV